MIFIINTIYDIFRQICNTLCICIKMCTNLFSQTLRHYKIQMFTLVAIASMSVSIMFNLEPNHHCSCTLQRDEHARFTSHNHFSSSFVKSTS